MTLWIILGAACVSFVIAATLNRLKDPPHLLGSYASNQNADETDLRNEMYEVFPIHFIDQAAIVRDSIISYTFRYSHVLEAQKLRDSLAILLASSGWRKLGGRLRRNVSEKLDLIMRVVQTATRASEESSVHGDRKSSNIEPNREIESLKSRCHVCLAMIAPLSAFHTSCLTWTWMLTRSEAVYQRQLVTSPRSTTAVIHSVNSASRQRFITM